ncbi:MAG: pilus assembly protein [Pirellulales bacterium]|nr:pilus assembly protein [Pirellulales bacterium]
MAVEFACMAPLLLGMIVGLLSLSRIYSVQNCLETAAREGARFAALDRSGMLLEGQTANNKLIEDVKNYLASNNIDPDKVTVSLVDASNPTANFDLDDPANDLKLFQVRVEVPYSAISYSPVNPQDDYSLTAALTFRNGRATLSE